MDYIKTGLKRGLIGLPFGVFITFTILIIVISIKHTNINADITLSISNITSHYIIGGLLGFFYAAMSVVFEIEEINFTRQTIIHFVITTFLALVPCALYVGWIPRNSINILIFLAIGIFVYFIIWLSFKIYWDNQIKKLNNKLDK